MQACGKKRGPRRVKQIPVIKHPYRLKERGWLNPVKENKKENLKEIKTVYLLGAGASADSDFKLPCLGDFFKESFEKEKYPYLYNFIKNYFPFTSLENLNLE